ncbi:prolipoprotein diacylglyceryl transferase family protein [Novosphingobium album (ex Liu et al. 2023)]|uniref:Prolipoprotein diacylglyceryl transferase n=1 Tax=Novosphingobium album (ex Liu et al. 2023) TaxID=3031130 RepID=A0ABT5WSN1_9SPHN|nr:prolipoprotein diacylglyceryl transferase family protein [Novosphingobium album (ex Liu et al. 2023)]MDE8653047.1 prolipoprotein diacylglyceryl transferase [Novosphingobium album (ex Liu et al. 2023)]
MLHPPTAWWAHYVFDLAAWVSATLAARWQYRRWPDEARTLAGIAGPSYFVSLALGAVAGAWLLGSANSLRAIVAAPSHSIAGALAGGIAAVEVWKWRHGVRRSTGVAFALPLAVGIAVGRLGCFFSGLADFTYGAPAAVPWAVDLGDGTGRHPVQLYESLAMALFALVLIRARLAGARWAHEHAFHAFVLVYAAQRFAWEFVKPYPPVAGPLNLFHLLMLGLAAYGIIWWRRGSGKRAPGG